MTKLSFQLPNYSSAMTRLLQKVQSALEQHDEILGHIEKVPVSEFKLLHVNALEEMAQATPALVGERLLIRRVGCIRTAVDGQRATATQRRISCSTAEVLGEQLSALGFYPNMPPNRS